MVKDVGFVAVEGGKWEMYVGGAAGAHIRKGDVLCVLDTAEEAITMTGRFIQYYRETAKWLERTYGWIERIGVDEVRAVIVEDRDGQAARLDEAIQAACDAFKDPWQEAIRPKTANQFADVVEV
jgi:nitrite reductase (NADH) large subunit